VICKATQTIAAIDAALEKDQGAAYRGFLREEILKLEDAYSTKRDGFRSHLGASLIGKPCARDLWYGFRWAVAKIFDGRILRLFNRGHLEEARFIALLRAAGIIVQSVAEGGGQFRIQAAGGHFGSSLDATVWDCPDAPREWILGEFKTHSLKSFPCITRRCRRA
jgi:hypothetical protein